MVIKIVSTQHKLPNCIFKREDEINDKNEIKDRNEAEPSLPHNSELFNECVSMSWVFVYNT